MRFPKRCLEFLLLVGGFMKTKGTTKPPGTHGIVLWLPLKDYALLRRVAERDRTFATKWAREALQRALRRAVRDEAR
jgi:hypothetical protein